MQIEIFLVFYLLAPQLFRLLEILQIHFIHSKQCRFSLKFFFIQFHFKCCPEWCMRRKLEPRHINLNLKNNKYFHSDGYLY
uniref:Secreted protein n=1 Tax=Pseudonaja textilis TaxID=8673 RepID=A0A670ZA81_PSETE